MLKAFDLRVLLLFVHYLKAFWVYLLPTSICVYIIDQLYSLMKVDLINKKTNSLNVTKIKILFEGFVILFLFCFF